MAVQIRKAVRRNLPLKMAIHGRSGAGKTFSALKLMSSLVQPGERIGVIDTENFSTEKYAGSKEEQLFDFDIIGIGNPNAPDDLSAYSPKAYIDALNAFREAGYKHVVIDSLSHLYMWSLEEVDIRSKNKGTSFTAWNVVGKMYAEVIRWITNSQMHIICTLRSKEEYDMTKDSNGKVAPKAVGLKPIIKEGFRYEFDITGQMDDAILTIDKTRCPGLQDRHFSKPGQELAEIINNWLQGGVSEEDAKKKAMIVRVVALWEELKGLGQTVDEVDLDSYSNAEVLALGKSLAEQVSKLIKVESIEEEVEEEVIPQ